MQRLVRFSWVAPLLAIAALAGCGAPAPAGSAEGASGSLAATAGGGDFPYGLGADISQDPGVTYDEGDGVGLNADFGTMASLPPVVDLRGQMSPVANQGKFGSCTSFATVKGLQEFLLIKQGRFAPQSPAFIWFEERKVTGNRDKDTGVPTELAAKTLDNLGTPDEKDFPYLDPARQQDAKARQDFISRAPAPQLIEEAKKKRILTGVHPSTHLGGVKKGLADGMPVLLSMRVFASIRNTGKDGVLPLPKAGDPMVGGHAVLAVGYDNRRGVIIVRNSWGPAWGDGGYFYMPYDYVRQGHVRIALVPKVH